MCLFGSNGTEYTGSKVNIPALEDASDSFFIKLLISQLNESAVFSFMWTTWSGISTRSLVKTRCCKNDVTHSSIRQLYSKGQGQEA